MRELPVLTRELLGVMERRVAPRESGGNVEVRGFGKAVAQKVTGGWPASAVFCFGGEEVGRLEEILAFFGDVKPIFYLVHGGYTAEVGRALSEAGFYVRDWKQTILYGLPWADGVELPRGMSVERVDESNAEEAACVSAEGFGWHASWAEGAKKGLRESLGKPGHFMYLARWEGKAAGVGSLWVDKAPGRWCSLGGGAVVPAFRGRGGASGAA